MINPAIAIFSDFAVWLVTLLPAVVAFRKGRGPWKVWSLAMALLTLPALLLFSGLGDPFISKSPQRWVVPLCGLAFRQSCHQGTYSGCAGHLGDGMTPDWSREIRCANPPPGGVSLSP